MIDQSSVYFSQRRSELKSKAVTEVKGSTETLFSLSFIDADKTANWTLTHHKGSVMAQ